MNLSPALARSLGVASSDSSSTGWTLSGCLPDQASVTQVPLIRFPFVIGRDPTNDLALPSRNVSKRHAEILHTTGAVLVRDLGSTNGTFVNGHRIVEATPVDEHDLLQFADVELRLGRTAVAVPERTMVSQDPGRHWDLSRISSVLNDCRVKIAFQPIIHGPSRQPYGYEALARTDVSGLESPLALFAVAAKLGQEIRLSDLCRREAVRTIEQAGVSGTLFLNTHPCEPLDDAMIASMKVLRDLCGNRPLVLEVHEEAVGEIETFCRFKAGLNALGIGLAFDDFGVGQSRLMELAMVRPDYIKFDRSLVKDLGTPTATHTGLVTSLHEQATSLGIATLAEGLETPESIAACDAIGFSYYQGYAFGKPQFLF